MKKLLVTVVLAVGGLLAYRKLAEARAEQELWNEVTDPVR